MRVEYGILSSSFCSSSSSSYARVTLICSSRGYHVSDLPTPCLDGCMSLLASRFSIDVLLPPSQLRQAYNSLSGAIPAA